MFINLTLVTVVFVTYAAWFVNYVLTAISKQTWL